ncbi:MAG: DEAD/DEAH box helicase [Pacificimonas sp.]
MTEVSGEVSGVAAPLARALSNRGYTDLTPVQRAMLKPELDGQDLLVSAQTGSGKTVAFGIAIAPTLLGDAERFARAGAPQALVIAPTRELALQVKRELDWLYAGTGAVIMSCVGGMDPRAERRALGQGADIVVGTPGRLVDHITRRAFDPSELKAVILDEADEMLDMGFREELEAILDVTPADRRTLLFSATVAKPIAKLAERYQRDAVRISTKEERSQHSDIDYRVLVAAPREREHAIINLLRYHDAPTALIFCNTRAAVNHMVARFHNRGFAVVALSGELSQNERNHALQALRDGRAHVCIATDVAARGIDLPGLDLVIHADLPSNPETLLHRSGRTGRAGRKGISAIVIEARGRNKAERLLRAARLDADWGNPPSADDVMARDEERMFADPILTDAAHEDEAAFAAQLLEKFPPAQIATAFLRLKRAGMSAPEDVQLVDVQPGKKGGFDPLQGGNSRERSARQDFEDSVWISLSVGRKQNAEPRWLIPLLCNAGDITKPDLGAIKMQQTETFVELNAEQADAFLLSIGPNLTLEKNIRVRVLDGKPDFGAGQKSGKPFRKGKANKFKGKKPAERFADKPAPNAKPKKKKKTPKPF